MFNKNDKDIVVAGHRGIKSKFPENTMLSYREAIKLGVDMIELDINMTKDNVLVLCHDNTIDRTTNGKGAIRDYTLEELQKFNAGINMGYDTIIPTFEELLQEIYQTPLTLNVEIKDKTFEVVDKTIALLYKYHMQDKFVIACFDAKIVEYAYEKYHVMTQGFPLEMMENASNKTNNALYSVGIPLVKLTNELVSYYESINIVPWAWCPDTVEEVQMVAKTKVRLVTCNNPIVALTELRKLGLHE